MRVSWPPTLLIAAGFAVWTSLSLADVTPEQTQELKLVKRDLAEVATLLRKKDYDAAETLLNDAEAKVREIIAAAGVLESNRRLLGLPQLIEARRRALELQRKRAGSGKSEPAGVSFKSDVAPLIAAHCLQCHGASNGRAGLNLSTFQGWKRGGISGPLLTPGAALNSLLIARLTARDPQARMPRERDALPAASIETIAAWINEGARFDGGNETASITELTTPKPPVEVVMPKGGETVSFTRDIAPFMVRLCLRCHSGDAPRGGLSLVTYADLLRGGDSGSVIVPGKREESRLFRLVGGLENPRMPQGQARITRKNYEDLVTWFDEGNVFDGDDANAELTSYVQSPEEADAKRFQQMTPEQFAAHRKERTERLWKKSLPREPHETLENETFLLIGNVTVERLQEVLNWADEDLKLLQEFFAAPAGEESPPWKGKLAIVVFSDRFGFSEYQTSVRNRSQSDGLWGDAEVRPDHSEAYIVLLDEGDGADEGRPGIRAVLREQLAAAFISRKHEVPDWLARGAALYWAEKQEPQNLYFRSLGSRAAASLKPIASPADVLKNGTFSPAAVGPVGFVAVRFLVERTSPAKLLELIQTIQQGTPPTAALMQVVGEEPSRFAEALQATLKAVP